MRHCSIMAAFSALCSCWSLDKAFCWASRRSSTSWSILRQRASRDLESSRFTRSAMSRFSWSTLRSCSASALSSSSHSWISPSLLVSRPEERSLPERSSTREMLSRPYRELRVPDDCDTDWDELAPIMTSNMCVSCPTSNARRRAAALLACDRARDAAARACFFLSCRDWSSCIDLSWDALRLDRASRALPLHSSRSLVCCASSLIIAETWAASRTSSCQAHFRSNSKFVVSDFT
mmetsp:Transcript_1047/g.2274  ORF Transcript_1047/g.2274 Transcript_1047/m.2274 type:complete len:235 (-) Transcript_1047:844-1548(-)